jgi:hypothetical protein
VRSPERPTGIAGGLLPLSAIPLSP